MLLGVSDFETDQSYHRGKMWLHNAWLHREGVVWGLDVQLDTGHGEIRVKPGLALDQLGRELHLEQDACLSAAAWFEAHREDAGFDFTEDDASITFNAHVVIRFKTCLTRQVPALSEPCEGGATGTAYSRVFETVEIFLRPGNAPERPQPYHRLRLLFGLDEPRVGEDGLVVESDQAVLDAPGNLDSFRRFAALDEIDLTPPDAEEYPVALANLNAITLSKTGSGLTLAGGAADVSVRPAHVATAAVQELLCGKLESRGGPVADPASVLLDETAQTLSFQASAGLAAASVHAAAFSLTFFDETTGWQTAAINSAGYDDATRTVSISFAGPLGGSLVRFIAKGSGPEPLLGANLIALNNGNDFVHMQERS
ncbi:MAG: hypothetical protein IH602_19700 [Bryobacteraceae bacterium]|nr:hypothetical protein [Bryobacteraceae bacterium]